MEAADQFLTRLDEMTNGFREAQIVFSAVRLGVFTALGDGNHAADDLARLLGGDARGVRILCDALVALGLITKDHLGYSNTPESRRYLCTDSGDQRLGMIAHRALLYDRWRGVVDGALTGRPAGAELVDRRLPSDKLAFAQAMADAGRLGAAETAKALDLGSASEMLDVGGGPGLYAIAFATRWPRLQVTILDDADTLKVAHQNVRSAGLDSRIELLAGDIFETPLPARFDLVLVSNVIHQYDEVKNRELVKRCVQALRPAGRLAVKDFVLDRTRTAPREAALFAVNMLVNTEAGDCYTKEQIAEWMSAAGCVGFADIAVAKVSRIIIGSLV